MQETSNRKGLQALCQAAACGPIKQLKRLLAPATPHTLACTQLPSCGPPLAAAVMIGNLEAGTSLLRPPDSQVVTSRVCHRDSI